LVVSFSVLVESGDSIVDLPHSSPIKGEEAFYSQPLILELLFNDED
jgi:hypothetical protein